MMDYKRVSELSIDEWVWVVFIVLSIMNIIGDEFEKDYCLGHSYRKKIISKNIFTLTLFISLLIYLFLENQRIQKLKSCALNHENTLFFKIRCFAGFLVVVATLLFLYCQVVDSEVSLPQIE